MSGCEREDRLPDGTRATCGHHIHGPTAPVFVCRDCLAADRDRLASDLQATRAELERVRRNHLRRMDELAEQWGTHMVAQATPHIDLHPYYLSNIQQGERLRRFAERCRAALASMETGRAPKC